MPYQYSCQEMDLPQGWGCRGCAPPPSTEILDKTSVNNIYVSDQDFPSLAGGRAVIIIHYISELASYHEEASSNPHRFNDQFSCKVELCMSVKTTITSAITSSTRGSSRDSWIFERFSLN